MTVAKPVGDMTDSPVALITGGSSGIGAAAARELLARGCRVAVTARDSRRLERLSEDLDRPAELLTLVGDAADHDAVHSAVEATVKDVRTAGCSCRQRWLRDPRRSRQRRPDRLARHGPDQRAGAGTAGERCASCSKGHSEAPRAHRQRRWLCLPPRQHLRSDQVGDHRAGREHQAPAESSPR
jgi:short chain dehydrogenase